MNLIPNHYSLRPLLYSARHHHNQKEITITLQAGKLFKGQGFDHKYIEEKINECLMQKQPFISDSTSNEEDEMLIEEAIFLARRYKNTTDTSSPIKKTLQRIKDASILFE